MTDVLKAISDALVVAIPIVGAAATAFVVAWFRRMALVKTEVVESAVRQASAQHGDGVVAEQAAIDELRRMSPKLMPKDIAQAVTNASDRQRAVRASMAPIEDEDG